MATVSPDKLNIMNHGSKKTNEHSIYEDILDKVAGCEVIYQSMSANSFDHSIKGMHNKTNTGWDKYAEPQ